jgi:hypothetical protein
MNAQAARTITVTVTEQPNSFRYHLRVTSPKGGVRDLWTNSQSADHDRIRRPLYNKLEDAAYNGNGTVDLTLDEMQIVANYGRAPR